MHIDTWMITGDGFHFGEHGLGLEESRHHFPSDSLFAALVVRLAAWQGRAAVERWLQPFVDGAPPFVLSSAFPFAGEVRFFPPPVRHSSTTSDASAKTLKKVGYVSEKLFREQLAGASLAEMLPSAVKFGANLAHPDEAQFLPEEIRSGKLPIWTVEKRPRVTLERNRPKSNLFHSGRVSYAPGCGLWFGVHWRQADEQTRELFERLLAELADEGLGGERSAGFGRCAIRLGRGLELPEPSGGSWATLSRYLPREDEIAALSDPNASFSLARVGGWLDSPVRKGQRRRTVNLVQEGSVLGAVAHLPPGQVVDVRPSYASDPDPLGHPVYRCGLALAVGLSGGEQ
jgi:CRISPR-associated protein Csm4